MTGKLALGTMQQRVSINGYLETNDYTKFGPVQIFPGGYFALPIEHRRILAQHVRRGAGGGAQSRLSPHAQATVYVGYSFSTATRARVRATRSTETSIRLRCGYGNDPPTVLDGPAQPSFNFNTTDFWAQTLSIGLAYRF
jgi:hypothetical protein